MPQTNTIHEQNKRTSQINKQTSQINKPPHHQHHKPSTHTHVSYCFPQQLPQMMFHRSKSKFRQHNDRSDLGIGGGGSGGGSGGGGCRSLVVVLLFVPVPLLMLMAMVGRNTAAQNQLPKNAQISNRNAMPMQNAAQLAENVAMCKERRNRRTRQNSGISVEAALQLPCTTPTPDSPAQFIPDQLLPPCNQLFGQMWHHHFQQVRRRIHHGRVVVQVGRHTLFLPSSAEGAGETRVGKRAQCVGGQGAPTFTTQNKFWTKQFPKNRFSQQKVARPVTAKQHNSSSSSSSNNNSNQQQPQQSARAVTTTIDTTTAAVTATLATAINYLDVFGSSGGNMRARSNMYWKKNKNNQQDR